MKFLDFISEDGHGFKVYFLFTLFNIPKIIGRLMMFVFFVSLFYSIVKLEDKNELIIFWINGIKKIEVKRNLLNSSSRLIYKNYFYSKKNNKPYIYGKLAISKDSYLKDKKNLYITNEKSLKTAHILRSRVNCILTTS